MNVTVTYLDKHLKNKTKIDPTLKSPCPLDSTWSVPNGDDNAEIGIRVMSVLEKPEIIFIDKI